MTDADVSIVVLVALFVATTFIPRFDLGLAALPAAFLVGLTAGVPADEVTSFFPAGFVVLVVGVTALFATARINGTLDWLLDQLLPLLGGRLLLVPLVPFVVGAVLTAVGTLPAAATAIVAPIALGLAARFGISPLMAAVLGITGIVSGLLSPLAVYGVTARQLSGNLGIALPDSAGAVLALALTSVLADINPLGITGGLILGAAEPSARTRLFRQLLAYGVVSVVVAPAVAWAAFGWW